MKRFVLKRNTFLFLFVLSILLSAAGFFLVYKGRHNYETYKLDYSQKGKTDYKVFLKENDYFEERFLGPNKTYITSLIDYIKVDYKYNFDFSDNVNGYYSYYLKGVVNANKNDGSNGNYYSKEYIITEEKKVDIKNSNQFGIIMSQDIAYNYYNDILNDFRSEYKISMDGELKIILVVSLNVKNSKLSNDVKHSEEIELSIPLTSQTIEVPIKTDSVNKSLNLASEEIVASDSASLFLKVVGYGLDFASLIIIVVLILFGVKCAVVISKYNKELNKILKTYDSILVNVSTDPDLSKLDTRMVTEFNELVDAHSEIRKPISYYETSKGAKFILVNDGIAWVYVLNRKLFDEGN